MATNDPNPTPRPTDPFTAKDAASIFSGLTQELRTIRETILELNKNLIKMQEGQTRIEAGLADSRIKRLDLELQEAELEKRQAEEALRKAEDKISLKQEVKDKTIDTQENIRKLTNTALEDAERQKQAATKARIDDIKWTVTKTVAVGAGVGAVALVWRILLFIWDLYQGAGAP